MLQQNRQVRFVFSKFISTKNKTIQHEEKNEPLFPKISFNVSRCDGGHRTESMTRKSCGKRSRGELVFVVCFTLTGDLTRCLFICSLIELFRLLRRRKARKIQNSSLFFFSFFSGTLMFDRCFSGKKRHKKRFIV